jgi:hypothetical protein
MEQLGSHWAGILKINTWIFFKYLLRISNFNGNLTITTGALHEHKCLLMFAPRSALLTIKVSEKVCAENQNTHFIFNKNFENVP